MERNLGSSVVKTLTQAYYNTYRHLYFDNFFFIQLLLDLLKSGLYGCGTTRTNRKGFPVALKPLAKKGLGERGRSRTYQYGNITATVWQDNKPVPVIASNGDPTIQTEVLRKGKDGSRVQVICPQSVALYNTYMGGVDHNDQLRGYYNVRLKCRKFYKYIFWFLFNVAVTNSYILFRQYVQNPDIRVPDLKTFHVELAQSLIADYCSRKHPGRPSLSAPIK